jgi:hypothetical protein
MEDKLPKLADGSRFANDDVIDCERWRPSDSVDRA